jgi:serpin B
MTANGKKVTEANNQFAIDLYTNLANDPDLAGENLFFSPWSISTALAITYEGARGNTAEEMARVFHFPTDSAVRRAGFYEVISGLNRGGSGYSLKTANALWAEKSYAFLPEYTSIARSSYSAKVDTLDFVNNPEGSRTIINRWVADQTAQKINNLLPAGSIHSQTMLVITNAIYFKGTWEKQFAKEKTAEEDFRVSPSQTVRVPMMRRTDADAEYWYAETDTLQVLGMPYAHKDGKELAMLVFLPKDGDLKSVEQSLTAGKVSELQRALIYKRVMVYIPKFKLETDYLLSETLMDMGMPTAFGGRADFSGMDGTGGLWIDDVFHSAFVDVNEEGTEAAAATATSMTMGMTFPIEPIPVFRADHPFIFLIQDSDTGNILFMGRVVNPAGG